MINDVFIKKNIFIKLAAQLDRNDVRVIKPYVDDMYRKIQLFCVTKDDKILMSLYCVLCVCNSVITNMLLKSCVAPPLYCIVEE
ncbi:Maph35 [Matsumuraeses phaseoli granulovirus]|uniref:Maph35 n=1 Tax=Matsumuraeses phaseoli granulovirus TaxID=2760664 RepID=A0AAE7SXP0_9BBAC|nr:Maph35 [Matsumuraeses phaseoli granulovirus]QOD39998.1 Maph35 [Matsumuraeses phaseoli granulovirus]